jgi:hypothetical protein
MIAADIVDFIMWGCWVLSVLFRTNKERNKLYLHPWQYNYPTTPVSGDCVPRRRFGHTQDKPA